jgi:hypothetical protein
MRPRWFKRLAPAITNRVARLVSPMQIQASGARGVAGVDAKPLQIMAARRVGGTVAAGLKCDVH